MIALDSYSLLLGLVGRWALLGELGSMFQQEDTVHVTILAGGATLVSELAFGFIMFTAAVIPFDVAFTRRI